MRERPELSLERPRRTFGRWLGAGLVMVGVHISGVAIGMMQWHAPLDPPAAPPPAVMIDLPPVAAPPPPRVVTLPEPEIVEPDIDLPPLAKLEDLPLLPDMQSVVAVKKKVKKEKTKDPEKVVQKAPDKKKAEKKSVAPKPVESKPIAINLPPPDVKTMTDAPSPTTREVEPSQAAALPTGPTLAGPTPSELAAMTQAKANWNANLNAHLLEYKRYPRAAKRRNKTGTPMVQFRMDRNGVVQGVKLVQSSGVDSLDDEAVALFWRATPLPALPPEMSGSHFEAPIAINFTLND